ncbi:MAG: hypothetical protein HeimC3_22700 [Candidatus Heimdallarchaeota archaeon LC_3]|nr:MAG: hypothetical protein HeimC3_22700 [Candidatus Heimdallarchaeota archaeon LC_3]
MSYAIEIEDLKKEFHSSKFFIMNKKTVHALKGVTFNVKERKVGIISLFGGFGVIVIIISIFTSYIRFNLALTEIFSPLFALFDDSLSFGFGWAAIFIIGWILGSFFSSLESKEFEIKIPNRKEVWRFFGGGLLLGIGAMLAGGCNIGHILGGIPELGLSSLIAIIFMALGNLLASRIFYVKFNNPLPVSSQLG